MWMMTKLSKRCLKFRHPLNLSEDSDHVIRDIWKIQAISTNIKQLYSFASSCNFPQFSMEYS